MDEILKRDENHVPVVGFITDDTNEFIRMGRIDDATKGLKVMIVGGAGTVSSGAGAPGTTPTVVGQFYVDTSGKKFYVSMGTTNSSDWTITN